jgi:hypothetical protein
MTVAPPVAAITEVTKTEKAGVVLDSGFVESSSVIISSRP